MKHAEVIGGGGVGRRMPIVERVRARGDGRGCLITESMAKEGKRPATKSRSELEPHLQRILTISRAIMHLVISSRGAKLCKKKKNPIKIFVQNPATRLLSPAPTPLPLANPSVVGSVSTLSRENLPSSRVL
jgi:hypothetical protein